MLYRRLAQRIKTKSEHLCLWCRCRQHNRPRKLDFFADWKTATTFQEKHALSLPIALNIQLDQTSYRIYNQAYLPPKTTQLKAIQNKFRNRLSLF